MFKHKISPSIMHSSKQAGTCFPKLTRFYRKKIIFESRILVILPTKTARQKTLLYFYCDFKKSFSPYATSKWQKSFFGSDSVCSRGVEKIKVILIRADIYGNSRREISSYRRRRRSRRVFISRFKTG